MWVSYIVPSLPQAVPPGGADSIISMTLVTLVTLSKAGRRGAARPALARSPGGCTRSRRHTFCDVKSSELSLIILKYQTYIGYIYISRKKPKEKKVYLRI